MKTIQETVEDIINQTPFIEEALHDKLINVSSLAREIQPEVAKRLSKEVKNGAIMMAINRMSPVHVLRIRKNIRSFSLDLKDFMVRSDLLDLTFKNSSSLQRHIARIYENIDNNRDSFFTVSQGIFETNMVLSKNIETMVLSELKTEEIIHSITELASITIKLPKSNLEQSGVYYFILKQFAWANIPVQEIISTTHEITLVVKENDIQRSFQILMNLKNR
jgi:aspartokinase